MSGDIALSELKKWLESNIHETTKLYEQSMETNDSIKQSKFENILNTFITVESKIEELLNK